MNTKWFSTLLAVLLIGGLVAAGLVLPGRLLHRQESQLLDELTSVPAADVAPYETNSLELQERIALESSLIVQSNFGDDLHMNFSPRLPLSTELGTTAAEELGWELLILFSPSFEATGLNLEWMLDSINIYAAEDNPQLSCWVLYFFGFEDDFSISLMLMLDGISGIPLFCSFTPSDLPFEPEALFVTMTDAYGMLFNLPMTDIDMDYDLELWYKRFYETDATDKKLEISTVTPSLCWASWNENYLLYGLPSLTWDDVNSLALRMLLTSL